MEIEENSSNYKTAESEFLEAEDGLDELRILEVYGGDGEYCKYDKRYEEEIDNRDKILRQSLPLDVPIQFLPFCNFIEREKTNLEVTPKLSDTPKQSVDRPFKCAICSETFTKGCLLKKHVDTHRAETPASGPQPHLVPPMKKHRQAQKAEKPFRCSICSRCFAVEVGLKVHMYSHTKKNLPDKTSSIQSKRLETQAKSYKCGICSKIFLDEPSMNAHMRTHSESHYKCCICLLTLPDESSMKAHVITHTEQVFSCGLCSKVFPDDLSVKAHMRTHSEMPYKCGVCWKTFSDASSIQAHMRTHTEAKPYKCGRCAKSFDSKPRLKIHSRSHNRSNSQSCSICLRKFKQSTLKSHLRSHKEVRPFKCTVCGKTFRQNCNLSNHMKTHTQ